MSAFDAVDGAHSDASKCYCGRVETKEFKEVRPGNETTFEVFKELARTRRRNAETVVPGIGRTRLGQRTLKCVVLIGTRSAQSTRASVAASTNAVASGELTAAEAGELSRLIQAYVKAIEATDIERRIQVLEEKAARDAK